MLIQEVFKSFNQLKILIIGDVMIDSYLWGKVDRISPEAPVPIVAVNKKENRLGGAANVAINIQALGATPILCSVIGNDDNAKLFLKLLKEQNLSEHGIIHSEHRVTTVKTRVIGHNHQMLRVDEEIDTNVNENETTLLANRIKALLDEERIDAIIFEDYDKGVITQTLIESITTAANGKNIPTTVDPKKRNFLHYKNITLFKPNLKELKEGLKIDFDPNDLIALEEAVQRLKTQQNMGMAMVTLSELGVYIQTENSKALIPAHIRNIADVSGAGDTVISVATLCLALGLEPEQIATLANLAGGLVCEKTGVVPIDKQQLLEEAIKIYNS